MIYVINRRSFGNIATSRTVSFSNDGGDGDDAPRPVGCAPLTLFAIDNKLPIAIFLIVSGVLPSASEGSIST